MFVDSRMATGRRCARYAGLHDPDPARVRRRRRTRGPVFRAGQLVSRRRRPDALYRLVVWRAEPGAAGVPAGNLAGRSDSRLEVLRSGAADAAGRLVEGPGAPA